MSPNAQGIIVHTAGAGATVGVFLSKEWQTACSEEVNSWPQNLSVKKIPVLAEREDLVVAFGVYWMWRPVGSASVEGKRFPLEWSQACCGLNSEYEGSSFSVRTTHTNRYLYHLFHVCRDVFFIMWNQVRRWGSLHYFSLQRWYEMVTYWMWIAVLAYWSCKWNVESNKAQSWNVTAAAKQQLQVISKSTFF